MSGHLRRREIWCRIQDGGGLATSGLVSDFSCDFKESSSPIKRATDRDFPRHWIVRGDRACNVFCTPTWRRDSAEGRHRNFICVRWFGLVTTGENETVFRRMRSFSERWEIHFSLGLLCFRGHVGIRCFDSVKNVDCSSRR